MVIAMKKYFFILTLVIVLLCCFSSVNATSNDTVDNVVQEINSNDELVSVAIDEQVDSVDDSVLSAKEKEDVNLTDDVLISSCDEEDVLGVTTQDTSNYLNDIKSTTSDEFYKFVNYLINQKGFKFNTKTSDDGYTIYSNSKYECKLYDGVNYVLPAGSTYFISKNRMDYVLDEFYPRVLYLQNDNVYLDELYLGWLKNVENYHSILNIGGTASAISSSGIQSSSQNSGPSDKIYDLRNVNGNN